MSSIWTIRRSATNTKVTGLCGGLAQHWRVDPVLVRLGFALLALSGGIGAVLYLAGWLLIPVQGSSSAPVDDFFGGTGRRWPKEVWVVLTVIACLVVFGVFGSLSPFGVGPAVVMAVIWYFGFYKHRSPAGRDDRARNASATQLAPPPAPPQFFRYPGPATPFTTAADAWRQRIEEHARQAAAQPAPPAAQNSPLPTPWPTYPGSTTAAYPSADPLTPSPAADPDPATAARAAFLATPDPVGLYTQPVAATAIVVKRSQTTSARRLRLVALVVLGLALASLGIADEYGVVVPLAAYFGTAALILGLTLVAATWLGRARGLLPIGFLVAFGLLATSAVGHLTQLESFNPEPKVYASVAELPAAGDTWEVGNHRVDLSRLKLAGDATYRAHLEAGRLVVVVPAGVNVRTNYTLEGGRVQAYGRSVDSGTELQASTVDPVTADPAQPTLTLDLSIEVGKLEVRR